MDEDRSVEKGGVALARHGATRISLGADRDCSSAHGTARSFERGTSGTGADAMLCVTPRAPTVVGEVVEGSTLGTLGSAARIPTFDSAR